MPELHANIINSLAKVIDSTQSGYAPRDLQSRRGNEVRSQNLTLNVVSTKNNQLLLEEPLSGKKLLINKNAVQGIGDKQLVRGDSLVLISSNNKFASFVVEKNAQQNPHTLSGQHLQNVSHSLSLRWPDVPVNIIKKTQPAILNQVQFPSNTQQATALANAITAIASKTGQPILTLNTTASVTFTDASQNSINGSKSAANGIRLNIDINNGKSITLIIPLKTSLSQAAVGELTSKLLSNQAVNLSLDINSKNKFLSAISSNSSRGQKPEQISASAIKEINRALLSSLPSIKQKISPLVVSPHSPNLQSGIAIAPTPQNLQALGTAIKQQLTEGVNKEALASTVVLLGQNSQSSSKIQLSLIDKPLTLRIPSTHLADAKIDDKTLASDLSKKVNTQASQFVRSASSPSLNNSILRNSGDAPNAEKSILGKTQQSQNTANVNDSGPANIHSRTVSDASNLKTQTASSLQNKLIEILTKQGNSEGAVLTKLDNLKAAIYSEMNQALPRAESMSKALPALLTQLNALAKGAGPELKLLITQVGAQIKNYLPAVESAAGNIPAEFADTLDEIAISPSRQSIRDLLTAAALPNINGAPVQAIAGVNSQSGLVNGLVAMLQASLQAKLIAQQPQLLSSLLQSSQFTQMLPKLMGLSKNAGAQSKILQDLNKLDPRGNLIGDLNKVLSSHSLHKLTASESALQNQDSFYYTLPNMFSPQSKDIEIVIKREQQAQQNKENNVQQAWQLSMKLDIGKSGEVLAKVKLLKENVDLNLYASNQALKEKILDNLPYLNRRLESLGLSVKPQCYLGKIPSTLHKTDYQVVQTYV